VTGRGSASGLPTLSDLPLRAALGVRPRTGSRGLVPKEQDARRRALGAFELQRGTDEALLTGLDLAQIEAFDGHDAGAEQHPVRLLVADRQIIDPDEPDAPLDERPRGLGIEGYVIIPGRTGTLTSMICTRTSKQEAA
jgi:hypothetical protein